MVDPTQISSRLNEAFGEQEPGDELVIVARCAHRDGERITRDSDLERLFNGYFVRVCLEGIRCSCRAPGVDRGNLRAGRESRVHADTEVRVESAAGEGWMRIGIDLNAGWLLRSATLWSGTNTFVSG